MRDTNGMVDSISYPRARVVTSEEGVVYPYGFVVEIDDIDGFHVSDEPDVDDEPAPNDEPAPDAPSAAAGGELGASATAPLRSALEAPQAAVLGTVDAPLGSPPSSHESILRRTDAEEGGHINEASFIGEFAILSIDAASRLPEPAREPPTSPQPQPAHAAFATPSRARIPDFGFLYIISTGSGAYKVGRTFDVSKRIDAYRTHSLPVLHYVSFTAAAYLADAEVKIALKDYRVSVGGRPTEFYFVDLAECIRAVKSICEAHTDGMQNLDKDLNGSSYNINFGNLATAAERQRRTDEFNVV